MFLVVIWVLSPYLFTLFRSRFTVLPVSSTSSTGDIVSPVVKSRLMRWSPIPMRWPCGVYLQTTPVMCLFKSNSSGLSTLICAATTGIPHAFAPDAKVQLSHLVQVDHLAVLQPFLHHSLQSRYHSPYVGAC